jgi:predicted SprT family Zn-dependent metalloprotease
MEFIQKNEHELREVVADCIANIEANIPELAAFVPHLKAMNVKVDLRSTGILGRASFDGRTFTVDFNRSLTLQQCKYLREETVPHEVAHVIGYMDHTLFDGQLEINAHNENWEAMYERLGGDPEKVKREGKTKKRLKGSAARQVREQIQADLDAGLGRIEVARNRQVYIAFAMQSAGIRKRGAANSCVTAQFERLGIKKVENKEDEVVVHTAPSAEQG